MEINASQVQNVLRTYQHLVKKQADSGNNTGESDQASKPVDRVTLSAESLKRLGEGGLRVDQQTDKGPEPEEISE